MAGFATHRAHAFLATVVRRFGLVVSRPGRSIELLIVPVCRRLRRRRLGLVRDNRDVLRQLQAAGLDGLRRRRRFELGDICTTRV